MQHLWAGTAVDIKDETLEEPQALPSGTYNLVVETDK